MRDYTKVMAIAMLLLSISHLAMANCGTTDYSGNTGRLYDMVTYVLLCSPAHVCHRNTPELLLCHQHLHKDANG
jgi:hypothetical protein